MKVETKRALDALFPADVRPGELELAPYRKVRWGEMGVITSMDYFDAQSLETVRISKSSPERQRTWLDRLVARSPHAELCLELRSGSGWRLLLRARASSDALEALPERRHLGTRVGLEPLCDLVSTLRALGVEVELPRADPEPEEGEAEEGELPEADVPITGAITLHLEGQERPARLVRLVDSLGAMPEVTSLMNGLRPLPGEPDEELRADLRGVLEPGEEVEAVWVVVSLRRAGDDAED